MKHVTFSSVQEWDAALLTLPENSFFELMRSIFGNIKTPFNKQKLIQDLTGFLNKKEVQETIRNYIDENDHRVIAAIGVLGEPFPGELESFFGGEYSYADLHSIVLNLEERLIVYRFKDEGKHRLALNPVLAPVLKPLIDDLGILFPSTEISGQVKSRSKVTPWNPPLMASLVAFVYDQHDLFKNKGSLRKKTLDDCKRIFPGLKLEPVLGTFRAAGLLQLDDQGKHHVDEFRLNQLAGLSGYERLVYLAAAMLVFYEQGEDPWQYFNKNRIQTAARELHQFLQSLDIKHGYPRSTIHKIFEILEIKGKESFFAKPASKTSGRVDMVLKVLDTLGLMEDAGKNFWRLLPIPDDLPEDKNPAGRISMDSPNSYIVFPEITFADALKLVRFSSVLETGTIIRFALTKESVVRGYSLGLKWDDITAVLKRLSGTAVDQNVVWQLKDWEKRYTEVALHSGIVLSLAKDRMYLANTEPLASMITATLAPGVFLLTVDEEGEAVIALEKAGVDIIARNKTPGKAGFSGNEKRQPAFPGLDTGSRHHVLNIKEGTEVHQSKSTGTDRKKAETQKDHFRTVLSKTKLSKDQRDELSARIDRRLILTDEQMDGSSVKYEKLEARGLDYVGKHNIAKQAISTGALLEVVWADSQGTVQKVFGIPSAIEKVNNETILVMHNENYGNDQGNTIRIALGRISLLRRIKQSIFGE